jgi:rhodanese-related sulfurtransferase
MVPRMITRTRIRTSLVIALVVAAPVTVAACGGSESASTRDGAQAGTQSATQGTVGAVSVEQAHDQMEKDTAVMVDVREPEELAEQAVPGTINIPLGQLEARAGEVPTGKPVLVFCRSGNRSQEGATILANKGYDTATVEGGIIAWGAAGLPAT